MKLKRIKNPQLEYQIFQRRTLAAVLIVLFCIFGLGARYFYLQILKYDEFLELSEKNRIKSFALPPSRGLIYDRNGELLVNNTPAYRLTVIPEKVDDIKDKLNSLKPLINLSDDEIKELDTKIQANQAFNSITLKNKLSEKQLARFTVNSHHFTGFKAEPYLIREYLYTNILAHVIGYVGRINESDLKALDKKSYAGSLYTGKQGIEKFYESTLHGKPGRLTVESNVKGRVLNKLEEEIPISGNNLNLTLDINLQKKSYEALGEHTGSVIAIDPNTGEILAMVSKPGFDPNSFVNGISQKEYSSLLNSAEKPLFNRSIKGGYEPGSTIKPYIALAALNQKIIDPDYEMISKGYYQLPKQARKYHDWKRGGHGKVNIIQSLAQSVNTFYYDIAVKLGIDKIHSLLSQFDFGQETGIDLLGEKKGILPSRAWKRVTKEIIWYPGETVITGIGQGYLTATPIQIAKALVALTNRGKVITPHLVKAKKTQIEQQVKLPQSFWELIHQGMIAVSHDKKGTSYAIRPENYLLAGKSGTSQVYGKKEEDVYSKDKEIPKHLRNHALFIAFAPADDPKIAVVVVAEHGHSGSKVAAPIAAEIIDFFIQGKTNDIQ